jgi:Kelch motif
MRPPRLHLTATISLLAACAHGPVATGPNVAAPVGAEAPHTGPESVPGRAVQPLAGLLPPMERAVTSFGTARVGGYLYALGGYSGTPHAYSREGQSAEVLRLPVDGSAGWERVHTLARGVQGAAAFAYDGRVCFAGGNEARNAAGEKADMHSSSDAGCLVPGAGQAALPALPAPRSSHDAVVVGSRVFVVGGWRLAGEASSGEFHADMVSLDLSQPGATWQPHAVPFRRRALAGGASRGKLVVVGGLLPDGKPSSSVDLYDPVSGSWERGPDFPEDAFGVAVEELGDAVVASARGGSVYQLHAGDAAWTKVAELTFPRFFHQLVATGPDEIVALGGIGGMDQRGRTRHVERVKVGASGPRLTAWSMAYPGTAKNRFALLVHGDDVDLFGGNNSLEQHDFAPDNFVAEGYRVHLPSMTITRVTDFPVKRQTMQTLSTGEVGFALGGFGHDGQKAVSFPEGYRFDFAREIWERGPSLPASRTQFGLAQHGGKLWVFGGLHYDPTKPGNEAFDHVREVLVGDTGAVLFSRADVDLPAPRRAFAGAVVGDGYLMVGGMHGEFQLVPDCVRFDFARRAYEPLACPSEPRLSGSLVAAGGKVLLVGGATARGREMTPSRSVQVLSPDGTSWTELTELPFDTRHMQAVERGGRVLMVSTHNAEGRITLALLTP